MPITRAAAANRNVTNNVLHQIASGVAARFGPHAKGQRQSEILVDSEHRLVDSEQRVVDSEHRLVDSEQGRMDFQ